MESQASRNGKITGSRARGLLHGLPWLDALPPASMVGRAGALASLFKNRDSSSGYKGPYGWDHYRVSWSQEDSMIGPLKEERDTKQVNPEGRNQ